MRLMLATLCLNEITWIKKLVEQHSSWPGLVHWCFVESADPVFREANPELVSKDNLSVDGTTEFLDDLCKRDRRFTHVKVHHVPADGPRDQYKCHLRNVYLRGAEAWEPDAVVVLDADEFYTRGDQYGIRDMAQAKLVGDSYTAIMIKQRHIWQPPYLHETTTTDYDPPGHLFSQEVVGGYWQVPHTRVWKFVPGMAYRRNHNWPEVGGKVLTEKMVRADLMPFEQPQCVHMGYASPQRDRQAKHQYYLQRGEGSEGGRVGRKRSMYVECREAHLDWRPGMELPCGARVIPYDGPIPEVFA